ncbi:Lymphokine-activated killer T-cell-originated protein kinase [Armadillidium vulgare]|nr:Lymphokine-activated killer T-cell-originated protein kinase [Armadillidium vulgare]
MVNSETFQTPSLQRCKKLSLDKNKTPVQNPTASESSENFKTPSNPSKKRRFSKNSLTPLLIPPSPCMEKLGYGTGVNVYLIERFSPSRNMYKSPWAVKKLNSRVESNPAFKARLEDETKVLKTLNHPNIIGFRSEGRSSDGNICLLMESGQKSLGDLIEERLEQEAGPFSSEDILKVAKALCSALHYLHEEAHLLHGDLKSSNVLVKDNFSAIKICDFGVTLKLDDKLTVDPPDSCYIGTECWSAPEVVMFETITHKTDMFSFGLILWEMIALCPPHHDKLDIDPNLLKDCTEEEIEEMEMEAEKEYEKALGTRPGLPDVALDSSYNKILEIYYLCTEDDPSRRPSAKQILDSYFTEQKS